ncbi:septal ring lytic transglycosylase RlpA family protein [Candidatus Poribacteria bacterium]|nr:septal ring lytic transglycosylase RlpA family protein [Candidatus Poribacteria bacterium]
MVESKSEVVSLEEGIASWYGLRHHGTVTASGEVCDMNELTAAHRDLPFNTLVRVINLSNGKSVVVRINDRGPFVKGRIIDLSKEAAHRLNMVHSGTSEVKLEILSSDG